MISLRRRWQQICSLLKHGGISRAVDILLERQRLSYSYRSFTYSWPKPVEVSMSSRQEKMVWFFLPHLLPEYGFAGLKTMLEIAKERLVLKEKLNIVLTDFSGKRESFFQPLGLSPKELEEFEPLITISDCSLCKKITLNIHPDDKFYVSTWWSLYSLTKLSGDKIPKHKIFGILQDDESLFYSTNDPIEAKLKKLAESSYCPGPVYFLNSQSLMAHMEQRYKLSRSNCAGWESFEPKIDRQLFFEGEKVIRKKQIFVYARPQVERNRFDLCVSALSKIVSQIPHDWILLGAGTLTKDVELGQGRVLKAVGKMPMNEYAQMLRETPVGLSLMASPHPSHPPLELEACGAFVVTNLYSTKNLSASYPRIISVELNENQIANQLLVCIERAQNKWSELK